jgi:hypothetical protein
MMVERYVVLARDHIVLLLRDTVWIKGTEPIFIR